MTRQRRIQAYSRTPQIRKFASRRGDKVQHLATEAAVSPGREDGSGWRDITADQCSKQVFIEIMGRMDDRYRGLGTESAPYKNPLDQLIDGHKATTSVRGMAIFAWSPEPSSAAVNEIHLVLALTFDKSADHNPTYRRIVVEMIGINPDVYPKPSTSEIHRLADVIRNRVVDLGTTGPGGVAPVGSFVEVTAFRPKSMCWTTVKKLHDCVLTQTGFQVLTERDCGDKFYWHMLWSKL